MIKSQMLPLVQQCGEALTTDDFPMGRGWEAALMFSMVMCQEHLSRWRKGELGGVEAGSGEHDGANRW